MASNRESTARECRHVGEALSAYVDGQLGEKDRRLIEGHLQGCPQCAAELAELRCLVDAMRVTPSLRPPRSFLLTPAMVEPKPKRTWLNLWSTFAPAVAGVAAVLLVALVFVDFRLQSDGSALGAYSVPASSPMVLSVPEPARTGDAALLPDTTVSAKAGDAAALSEPAAAALGDDTVTPAGAAVGTAATVAPSDETTESSARSSEREVAEATAAPAARAMPAATEAPPPPSLSAQATTEESPAVATAESEAEAPADAQPDSFGAVQPAPPTAETVPTEATANAAVQPEATSEAPSAAIATATPETAGQASEPISTPAALAAAPPEHVPDTTEPSAPPALATAPSSRAPLALRLAQVLAAIILAASLSTWAARLIRQRG